MRLAFEQGTSLGKAACILAATCVSLAMAAPPSKYDDLRDPFLRPDPKSNTGTPTGRPNSRKGDWEAGHDPKQATKPPAVKPVKEKSALEQYVDHQLAIFEFLKFAWRPAVAYTSNEVKSFYIQEFTIAFRDVALAYLRGPGWAKTSLTWLAPRAIERLFTIYGALELAIPEDTHPSSELSADKLPVEERALRNHLRKLEQRVKEEPTLQRLPFVELPQPYRGPASQPTTGDLSTEKMRRYAMFADPDLTRDGARLALARAAGRIYGPTGEQVTASMLWLYDTDRIHRDGLSQQAMDWLDELGPLLAAVKPRKRIPNACLIQAPQWVGTPAFWACTLPYTTSPGASCYCLAPPPNQPVALTGVPKTYGRGMVCDVPGAGMCPMVHSQPVGTFCQCSGFQQLRGQVR